MNYSELKAQVAMHRTDLATQLPTFISLAEAVLFREISVKGLEISLSGVTTAGGVIALPTDLDSIGRITTTYGGVETALDYDATPATGTGQPTTYMFEAGGLKLDSTSEGYAYTLYYTPKLTALSDANPTNWLLTNAPDAYLTASKIEMARWTGDDTMLQQLSGLLGALIDSVQRLIARTGQPMRSGLQIKPRTYY